MEIRRILRRVSLLPLLFGLSGCAAATETQLRTRAASDLKCGEKDLRIQRVDGLTRRVQGCDRTATYIEVCDGPRQNMGVTCTWTLDSHQQPMSVARPESPAQPSESKETHHTCMPNDTKECLGPGACRGAQACREDGKSYSPCDCGPAPASSAAD